MVEHLELVARRAEQSAETFGAGAEAHLAGLLHDAGKASELFTRRLRGQASGLDHWSPGASLALRRYQQHGIAAALAIAGHHVGLGSAAPDALRALHNLPPPEDRTLTVDDPGELPARLAAEGIELPDLVGSLFDQRTPDGDALLDVRMLFSALVDADFLETEAHFDRDPKGERRYRPEPPELQPSRALEVLQKEISRLTARNRSRSSTAVQGLRSDLFQACWEGAEQPPGLFTLSAPTGSGKTLAMLAFALRHAARHGLRRVVMAVPYLSILEQTAQVYRSFLEPVFGSGYLLEHHSLAGTRGQEPGDDEQTDAAETLRRRQAENWDAPLVLTTSVQLLESLFAHRPGPCRKLHRLSRAVLLFDEVQTLPPPLVVATLATLSHLTQRFGSSVVFSTATQPAFEHLDDKVQQWSSAGWQPRELVPEELGLFDRVERVRVEPRVGDWSPAGRVPWERLADELAEHEQVLCIVNLKRHARELASRLRERDSPGLFHLSTAMCPAHRQQVLDEVRSRLDAGRPCRLVSTQCVEAGVDVDFPVVYRAFGPLDAIAQAAGRCNRNGRMAERGRLVVFLPDEAEKDVYPSDDYRLAADVTRELLQERGLDGWNLQDPELFDAWYRRLYDLSRLGDGLRSRERDLHAATKIRNFEEVARLYRLIPDDTVQVVVPWDAERYEELRRTSEGSPWLTRDWMRAAQVHSVSLYRPQLKAYRDSLVPAPLGARTAEQRSDDWFFLRTRGSYDDAVGLLSSDRFLEV